ncbi:MAG: M20 family metallopeptidase [Nitrososphaerales archaeon]
MAKLSDAEENLLKTVKSSEDLLVEMTKDFISIPTVNPPGSNYVEMVNQIDMWCRRLGLDVEIIDVPDKVVAERSPESQHQPRKIILAYLGAKEKRPHIHFNGHYDVVPATGTWKVTDPFTPILKDGKIYGRGASDMKGPLASILVALKALAEYKNELNGVASFSAVPDEEIGGEAGARYLVEKKKTFADVCIIAEPSGVETIWDSHKGQAWLEVTVKGKAAHASTPWLGVNAFERASRLVVCLADNYVKQLPSKQFNKLVPYADAIPVVTLGGVVRGGGKINIVPDNISFTVDRRTVPGETFEEAKSEFVNALYACADKLGVDRSDLEVKTILAGEPCVLQNEKLKTEFAEVVEDALSLKPSFKICQGGLDMRHFISATIPTLTYGGGDSSKAHIADEYAKVSDLLDAAKVYALYAYRMLSKHH